MKASSAAAFPADETAAWMTTFWSSSMRLCLFLTQLFGQPENLGGNLCPALFYQFFIQPRSSQHPDDTDHAQKRTEDEPGPHQETAHTCTKDQYTENAQRHGGDQGSRPHAGVQLPELLQLAFLYLLQQIFFSD